MCAMKRLLASMGAAVLLAGGAAAVNAHQAASSEPDRQRARAVAAAVTAPPGATVSDDCNGPGIVGCWTSSQPVPRLAEEMSERLALAAGAPVTTTCDEVPVSTTGTPRSSDSCFVRVRYEAHGVFIFLDPLVERNEGGGATVAGSRVVVQAA